MLIYTKKRGVFAATDVALLGTHQLTMTIHQGVYHQVKRMIAAVGNKVEVTSTSNWSIGFT